MARSPARIASGVVLALLGASLAAFSWTRPDALPLPADAELAVGGVLLLVGVIVAATGKREPQPEASVPAHVAFASRMEADLQPAPRVARPARVTRADPSDAHAVALAGLDEEIRDLTKRINKAGVMLATGKLSNEAYKRYVEELKRQRGSLEADRVHLELRRRTA